MKERILISACLLGRPCRYDGTSRPLSDETLRALRARYELVPVCPELLGGMEVTREPAERKEGRVIAKDGSDVTAFFMAGAAATLRIAQRGGCKTAILKERSPSCGVGEIYDGSFSGKLVSGDGVTALMLRANAIRVLGESELEGLLKGKP